MPDDGARERKILDAAHKIQQNTRKATEKGFRIIISGKGGVGKTTITALLARIFAEKGFTTLAVDEDPQMNLPFAAGIPWDERGRIVPLTQNLDYVEEKTGARPGAGWGLMLTLNPDVSDVVERFGVRAPGGVNILVMGTVVQAASGCLCPENTLLESVIRYINLREGEVILMDTPAGVEHFGRSIAKGFHQAVIVTDPSFNSVQVAERLARLAKELGIPSVHLVINRVRSKDDTLKVREILGESMNLFSEQFFLPYEEDVIRCEPGVEPLLERASPFMEGIRRLQETLEEYGNETRGRGTATSFDA